MWYHKKFNLGWNRLHQYLSKSAKIDILACLLAESSSGISFWLAEGELAGGAFQKGSFFEEYEFNKLNPPNDTKLVVINVHCENMGENCGTGSLAELKKLAIDKFGKDGYTCHDVTGDPDKPNEELTNKILGIINSEQNG